MRIVRMGVLGLVAMGLSSGASAQDATLGLSIDTVRHELVLDLAPVTIPSGKMMETPARALALPVDGWLQGYAVDLVDANGHPLSHSLIHHVNLIAPERRERQELPQGQEGDDGEQRQRRLPAHQQGRAQQGRHHPPAGDALAILNKSGQILAQAVRQGRITVKGIEAYMKGELTTAAAPEATTKPLARAA